MKFKTWIYIDGIAQIISKVSLNKKSLLKVKPGKFTLYPYEKNNVVTLGVINFDIIIVEPTDDFH